MRKHLFTAFVALGALVGCDSNRDNVQEANKDLSEARQEAAQDVSKAQGEAVQDINETKKEAAENVQEAKKDVQEAQKEASTQGTTSGATQAADEDVKVTPEQCAQFATDKKVTEENRKLYEACSKIDKKSFR